ncbi:MAG TPA: SDR family oxidoreductase [Bacillota bacterium]|nr:SDR family oxidoreductase [Bacillota bacterium]
MKVLFIGGTGNISGAVSRLAVKRGIELFHLNRGTTKINIPGVTTITGDISAPAALSELAKHSWDAVVNWIAFTPSDIERDLSLFQGKTKQYIFISSASVYQSPPSHPVITESTPLHNPFWDYSRNKIGCEERLNQAYRNLGFPMTIVRPSLTYDTVIPVALAGFKEYTIVDRILNDKKIIVHGDGTSLWTVTHADDFAAGFLGLVGNPQAIGHSFHITSDEILTWNQLYTILAEAVGKPAHIVHIASDFICRIDPAQTGNLLGDKGVSVIFNNTKIKTFVPGFKAVIPFYEGIRRTLAWFDANPEKKFVNPKTNEMMDRIITAYEGLK